MPPRRRRNWIERVEDMLEAIEKIEGYTSGMSFEAFIENRMAADAVTRNIGIIGEAVRHVPPDVRARYASVPWVQISDMRNFVIHDYPAVDLELVWRTIRDDLPPLKGTLGEVLKGKS